MKRNLIVLTLFSVVILFSNCQGQSGAERLPPENFEKKLSTVSEKIILDVRTEDEFSKGHLADAVQIDYYKSDFKNQLTKLDKNKPVFVYCAAGIRSNSAAKILTDLGFKQVYDLQGGFNAWSDAKKPIEN